MGENSWTTVQIVVRNSKLKKFQNCINSFDAKVRKCSNRGDFIIFRIAILPKNKKNLLDSQINYL